MNIDVKSVQRAVVGHGLAHDSAAKQIAGDAAYIDDMNELPGTLHAALVTSPVVPMRPYSPRRFSLWR